jgi:hypothetical protein
MDHYSILDHGSSSPAMEGDMPGTSGSGSASVSAGIAAANSLLPSASEPGLRFPAEDAGRSLAEMAHADLDAALQLLAERAEYITGASGAAIALRRGERNDMLCRASAGSNAPELGALLSTEYGLSGESVRTRQLLRCDDAERDPRVNHDVCRELGIASVVVMPIVSDEKVLGVFELLSGKPRAFDERDLSALVRLGEMVETAVKHATPAQIVPAAPEIALPQSQPRVDVAAAKTSQRESSTPEMTAVPAPALPAQNVPPPKQEEAAAASKKGLFWSAAMRAQGIAQAKESTETLAVPPVLRNLQKCQACGFPVSQGRAFCVECEEKQWRGQRLPQPEVNSRKDQAPPPDSKQLAAVGHMQGTFVQDSSPDQVSVEAPPPISGKPTVPAAASAVGKPSQDLTSPIESVTIEPTIATQTSMPSAPDVTSDAVGTETSTLFLTSASQSQSWFASNKYILGALLVVAIIVGAIAWLR